jgi:hypothetical protein
MAFHDCCDGSSRLSLILASGEVKRQFTQVEMALRSGSQDRHLLIFLTILPGAVAACTTPRESRRNRWIPAALCSILPLLP